MYSLNKIVLTIMALAFLGSTATSGYVMHSVISKITATAITIPNGKFCVPHNVSDKFYVFWIPMLAFECLLCTLALIRGFQAFVTDGSLFRRGRELIRILLLDSVLYFLVITATYMTCLLVWIVGPVRVSLQLRPNALVDAFPPEKTTLLEVPIGFSVAMSCVLANRLILNVREVNRTLEQSKPSQQQDRTPSYVRDSDFIEYYYGSGELGAAATMSFGNQGTLTQFEMDQAAMAERPWAPEPPSPASVVHSPSREPRVRFDLEISAESDGRGRPWKAWVPEERNPGSSTDSARSSSELEHPVPFTVL
ncbi:hypothetical protein NMY22_g5485 [Coprinellus aureogranulatus]|nr:hypothetical protein NMY22_g5485 [Coprinellus aureogranulatus]